MMMSLGVENNSKITISVTELPTGYFVKLKPQSVSFLTKLTNPAAILERKLRDYAALKVGEVIYFRHVNSDFYLEVLECKPSSHGAICIIEANLKVEFEAPDGYVEPSSTKKDSSSSSSAGGGYGGAGFAMDDDFEGEVDDLGVSSDSESDDSDGKGSAKRTGSGLGSRSKTPTPAFSGTGHRPSGRAVKLEPTLPELASSPSGRTFITASGSLVIGPPAESSLPASPASTPAPASISAATAASSSSTSSKNSAKPSVNNPVPEVASPEEDNKFKAFSGAGHRLK